MAMVSDLLKIKLVRIGYFTQIHQKAWRKTIASKNK